ncbi:HD domain-containing protein [Rivularia sp. PCC 7116]|uniref:HD domain-containing protein n=1 Tax=Rivularia sp. PCC 7116 TaxID=373994 RepID=UPI00029EDDED|nr:HD domain-containing protein [Rivularia sp. PCC 7116]AFY56653.1 HD domain-containing protein [Rivularia sp. PCC 7116]
MESKVRNFENVEQAYEFLKQLNAPPRLIRHVYLVGEAADLLIQQLNRMDVDFDEKFVRLGVAFHDAGKIIHSQELFAPGNHHESDGEKLLISKGVNPRLARCCLSHARWKTMACSLEELIIALADKLWKGKREVDLEKIVVARIAKLINQDFWEVFIELDSHFEIIASQGEERLCRSL